MLKHLVFLLILLPIFSACSSSSDDGGYACPTVVSYPNSVTVSGIAKYEYRDNGNQAINATPNPIRKAEVQVLNESDVLIQCGVTDNSGAFSLSVPQADSTYTLKVNSKIYNDTTKVFVFNNPVNLQLHALSSTFSASSSQNLGTLTATAATSGSLKGGAFNILDKILDANEYLVTETANCSTTIGSECTPFTGLSTLAVFWDKGVNPGDYFGVGPLSFYLPGESELYLLGGEDGDVDNSDTDHFDNSIILHEYGHFVEDILSESDSPAGSHNGNSIIDPRLAWGEGWANFFQAAITTVPTYHDTSGTIDGTASTLISRNLETADTDIPSTMGEGNFREFSVSRLLWDAIDTPNDTGADLVTTPFAELWTLFTSTTAGLKSSEQHFRSVSLFHHMQQNLGFSDWSTIRTLENHRGSQRDYARNVASGACAATSITAANISLSQTENGTATNSNQFASNDFYKFYHAGGSLTLRLNYTPTTEADLDLYLYVEDYKFTDTSTYAATPSATRMTAGNDGNPGTETITATLAAGYYMINVRVYTGILLGSATYTMSLNGASLCPD